MENKANKKILGIAAIFMLSVSIGLSGAPKRAFAEEISVPAESVVIGEEEITSEISVPETSTSEISVPETSTSEISVPETSTSEISVPETSETEVSEETVKGIVVVKDCQYGDLLIDVLEGEVGTLVTIYAKPYTLCKLTSLQVNGISLVENEDGNYVFALAEGENVVTAVFEIDNKQLEMVSSILADAKDGNWSNIFSIENLITVISWVITTLLSSGFFITLLKYKRIKTKTTNDVTKIVEEAINNGSSTAINDFLKKTFGPTFDKISEHLQSTDETCKTLARCFILSQEDTPEARLAIIQELTKLQTSNEDLAVKVRAIINKEIEKNEEIKNARKKAIEEMEEANESLGSKPTEENSGDDYGQF